MTALAYLPSETAPVLDEDQAFVELLAARDAGAWRKLFEARFRPVYNFAYARTGDPHQAEDVAAEVFSEAIKSIRGFRYQGIPVSAWLFRIARNVTADHLTKRRRRAAVSLEANEWIDVANRDHISDVEAWTDLRDAIAGLKREHQEVLILRFIQGLSLAAVAQAMGKSVGAVKLLQFRAATTLRKRLREGAGG